MGPDLDFAVEGADVMPMCVTPTLALRLAITNSGSERVHSVALHCQVRIEAQRRRYEGAEKDRLFDLFGGPERWSQTLRSLLWGNTDINVPGFTGSTRIDLPLACTYDFNVLAARYMYALEGGRVPLVLLFSGTIFYAAENGSLQVSMVSWSKEAGYDLPVTAWRSMMDAYYPNSAWLCLRQDAFDRLAAYKSRRGLATWEQALESLLAGAEEPSAP